MKQAPKGKKQTYMTNLQDLQQKLVTEATSVSPVRPVRDALLVILVLAAVVVGWVAAHVLFLDVPMAPMDIQMKAMALKVLGLLVMLNMHVICIPHILRSYRYGWYTLALLGITALFVAILILQMILDGVDPMIWEDWKVCAETFLLALGMTLIGFYMMRRAAPCTPFRFGVLAGLAASLMAIAAQLMLTPAMEADKVLFTFVAPAAVVVLGAGVFGKILWRW